MRTSSFTCAMKVERATSESNFDALDRMTVMLWEVDEFPQPAEKGRRQVGLLEVCIGLALNLAQGRDVFDPRELHNLILILGVGGQIVREIGVCLIDARSQMKSCSSPRGR